MTAVLPYRIVTPDLFTSHRVNAFSASEYDALRPHDGDLIPGDSLSWQCVRPLNTYDSGETLLIIEDASWGEYDGSGTHHRANHAYLTDNYGRWFVTVGRSSHDGRALALIVGTVIPLDLVELIDGLDNYPLIDDSGLSELESELEAEDWESWGRDEFAHEIQASLPAEWDVDFDPDVLDALAWDAMSDGRMSWQSETAVGGYFDGLKSTARAIAADLLA